MPVCCDKTTVALRQRERYFHARGVAEWGAFTDSGCGILFVSQSVGPIGSSSCKMDAAERPYIRAEYRGDPCRAREAVRGTSSERNLWQPHRPSRTGHRLSRAPKTVAFRARARGSSRANMPPTYHRGAAFDVGVRRFGSLGARLFRSRGVHLTGGVGDRVGLDGIRFAFDRTIGRPWTATRFGRSGCLAP